MRHSQGLYKALLGTQYAFCGPTQSCNVGGPFTLPHNGNTAIAVATTHQRHFSASSNLRKWHKGKEIIKKSGRPKRFGWVAKVENEDLYDILEFHMLDPNRRATDRFPVMEARPKSNSKKVIPKTLDPYNPENETPPDPADPGLLDPPPRKKYKALALDCELVSMKGGEQGLIRVAVVDFFTGNVLLHGVVRPAGPVTDWRQEFTGLNKYLFREKVKKGKVLSGWEEVRERIFEVSTPETIFVGHALANDLRVLRIATDRAVDSMAMLSLAIFGNVRVFPRNWSLRGACHELMGLAVQKKRQHDPLADALATRELVLWCITHPNELGEWADRKRANMEEIVQKEREKEMKKESKRHVRLALRRHQKINKQIELLESLVQQAAEVLKKMEEEEWQARFADVVKEPEEEGLRTISF